MSLAWRLGYATNKVRKFRQLTDIDKAEVKVIISLAFKIVIIYPIDTAILFVYSNYD